MESLRERFDALQEKLIEIYEAGSTNLEDQIKHWDIVRKESVIMHFARRKGLTRLGLQQLPALTVSETNAKNAIMMSIYLQSLNNSQYASESWGLSDTSLELFLTAPMHTFKKSGYSVDVLFDNDEDNLYTYTAWRFVYYQDDEGEWHKVESGVDYDGIFYKTVENHTEYYIRFQDDAPRFSRTGRWTVKYKSQTISTSVTSTSGSDPVSSSERPTQQSSDTLDAPPQPKKFRVRPPQQTGPSRVSSSSNSKTTKKESPKTRLRRRRGEGEPTTRATNRRTTSGRARRRLEYDYPTPEQVGSVHRLPQGSNLGRLGRLQEEARDPPVVLLRGLANTLKCFRFRCKQKYKGLFQHISTTFSWVGEGYERLGNARILIAFQSTAQREKFLAVAVLPKGTEVVYGSLNAL